MTSRLRSHSGMTAAKQDPRVASALASRRPTDCQGISAHVGICGPRTHWSIIQILFTVLLIVSNCCGSGRLWELLWVWDWFQQEAVTWQCSNYSPLCAWGNLNTFEYDITRRRCSIWLALGILNDLKREFFGFGLSVKAEPVQALAQSRGGLIFIILLAGIL